MESKEDKRTGYYIVEVGTNRTKVEGKNSPIICDTEVIAQKQIDDMRAYRKQAKLPCECEWTPISIQEFNRKYVV